MATMASDQPSEDGEVVRVLGVGEVWIAATVPPADLGVLLSACGDAAVTDSAFRSLWLGSVTDCDEGAIGDLTEAQLKRVSLAVLRSFGLERRWKSLYGSSLTPEARVRVVVGEYLRRSSEQRTDLARSQVVDIAEFRAVSSAVADHMGSLSRDLVTPFQRTIEHVRDLVVAPFKQAMERIRDLIVKPFRQAIEQVRALVQPTVDQMRASFDEIVRRPAFRHAIRVIGSNELRKGVSDPLRLLQDARAGTIFDRLTKSQRPVEAPEQPNDAEVEIPDSASLAAFFEQERADPSWRMSNVGWLLAAVPLSVGAAIHEHFGVSPSVGLRWVANRFARHEIQRRLRDVIANAPCSASLRQRLDDGTKLFFQERYASSDTLLTAGLEGLLFELGRERGVLSIGDRPIKNGKASGSKIRTGADGRLLAALELKPSEQMFLAGLSVGKNGNPPRHGTDAPLGSQEHAAAALLGILLVFSRWEDDHRWVAGVLAA